MIHVRQTGLSVILIFALFVFSTARAQEASTTAEDQDIVQGLEVLTVAEGKRLIAKGVARMPIVLNALKNGTVIVVTGSTNTYVAEELLGRPIEHGAFVSGRTYPAKGGKKLQPKSHQGTVIMINGKETPGLSLDAALQQLKPGDVVVKGANALNHDKGIAGVMVGSENAGTTGRLMPFIVGRKAHLVVPVGLEKEVAGDVLEIQKALHEPVESLNRVQSMFLLAGGRIVSEIEAVEILTGVRPMQVSAGGFGGAEGAIRLLMRGPRPQVKAALELIQSVHGEPPFVK